MLVFSYGLLHFKGMLIRARNINYFPSVGSRVRATVSLVEVCV